MLWPEQTTAPSQGVDQQSQKGLHGIKLTAGNQHLTFALFALMEKGAHFWG